VVAALAQGITLGGLLQGIAVNGRSYGGGWWDWLTPFSVAVGVALVCGYALLGATWLIMKSEGSLLDRCYPLAQRFAVATIAGMAIVSAWTPFLSYDYYRRWFAWPQVLFTAQVPLLVAIASVAFFFALRHRRSYWPFLIALALFALGLIGLGISLYPYVVPRSITIWDAAAPTQSLTFMLVGAAIMVPIILAYTGYAYWVFRGKTADEGYH
jgi:cytochrome d ubiquinol oxidase subunit II